MDFYKEIQPISRAGRQTIDKYLILKDRESILSGKIKRKPKYLKKRAKNGYDGLMYEEALKTEPRSKPVQHSPKNSLLSPSFKAQDRESYYKSHTAKDHNPPLGHYKPNFDAVKKHVASPTFWKPKTQRKKQKIISPSQMKDDQSDSDKDQQLKKVTSLVDMKHMIERKPLPSIDLNENRLLSLNLSPRISTAVRSVSSLDFAKQTGRKPLYTSNEFYPDYRPNKEKCMPKLGSSFDMNKITSRKGTHKLSCTPDPYDVNYALVTKKPISLDFSKFSPRDRLPNSPLPVFMQSSIGRMSLDLINSKSFTFDRINSYAPFLLENN
ncbi:unnamed protein product [Blepharisma stoltei]|uniref:Uncharacterized protein n=1 Tax=Blepharisma stoltei TaxID=1481888 RepID=A0AAU9INJ1_9CILI|nr:unnamed protein product [Blepharisma stoltei]